jgi:hypothetical protein
MASVLDRIKIKAEGTVSPQTSPPLEVVGNCPTCGAPIYGNKVIPIPCGPMPVVYHGCNCRTKSFEESIQTK